MALSDSILSGLIQSEIIASMGKPPEDPAQLQKMADAIAKAVVTHITIAAEGAGTVTSGAGSGGAVLIPPGGIT